MPPAAFGGAGDGRDPNEWLTEYFYTRLISARWSGWLPQVMPAPLSPNYPQKKEARNKQNRKRKTGGCDNTTFLVQVIL